MSVASSSSFASGYEEREIRAPNPGDDSEPWEDAQTITTGLFGVLYTVSKEKETTSWRLLIFKLVLDVLQLFLLTVNPQYGYDIDKDSRVWAVASFIQLNAFMTERGYAFFIALMYLMAAGLVINVGLCAWVGHSFQSGKFDHVWPIVLLRYYSLIFYQMLDVASLTLFLITLDCQYFDVPDEVRYRIQEFPTVECWSMPHMIHVAVASASFVVFVSLATLFSMAELQLNPLTKNYLAMAHSKVEVTSFGIKVVMTLASVFVTNIKWLSVVYLAASAYLLWLWLLWCPHVYDAMNYVKTGMYTSIFYTAILTFVLAFKFGVDTRDPDAVASFQHSVTQAMWYGLAPVGVLGCLASYLRLRFFRVTLVQRFSTAPPDAKAKSIYKFTDPRQVEIAARCCRCWMDSAQEVLEPEGVLLAEVIIKAGLQLMPTEPFMIIWYSSFLIDVQGSYQSGYTQLQLAKKRNPSLLERFSIFSREQEHAQKATGAQNGESAVDLVSYVEFQRNHRLCLRTHKESLLAMRAFWQHLLHSRVKFEALARCIHRIEVSVKQAERVYRMVLQRHSNSVKILKLYARFLEGVKQNPWDAAKWLAEAERLELLEEEQKDSHAMGDMGGHGGTMPDMDESSRAVVVINAHCIIQVANKAAHAMFGYNKGELKLKEVSLLMPEPYSSKHTAYVRAHVVQASKDGGTLLNRNTELIGLHREKYVFPVSVHVTKVSGIGEDSTFLGIMEPIPLPSNTARMWVLSSGAIMAVDPAFTNWFGYGTEDVAGVTVEELVPESGPLNEVLARAKRIGDLARDARLGGPAAAAAAAAAKLNPRKLSAATAAPSTNGAAGSGPAGAEPNSTANDPNGNNGNVGNRNSIDAGLPTQGPRGLNKMSSKIGGALGALFGGGGDRVSASQPSMSAAFFKQAGAGEGSVRFGGVFRGLIGGNGGDQQQQQPPADAADKAVDRSRSPDRSVRGSARGSGGVMAEMSVRLGGVFRSLVAGQQQAPPSPHQHVQQQQQQPRRVPDPQHEVLLLGGEEGLLGKARGASEAKEKAVLAAGGSPPPPADPRPPALRPSPQPAQRPASAASSPPDSPVMLASEPVGPGSGEAASPEAPWAGRSRASGRSAAVAGSPVATGASSGADIMPPPPPPGDADGRRRSSMFDAGLLPTLPDHDGSTPSPAAEDGGIEWQMHRTSTASNLGGGGGGRPLGEGIELDGLRGSGVATSAISFTSAVLGRGGPGGFPASAASGLGAYPRELRVQRVMLRHKFTAQLVQAQAAVFTGGAGSHTFQVVTFQCEDEGGLTLVVDRRGKLVHITSGLAELLGTTPKALLSVASSGHALEALMPQPLGSLHNLHLQDYPLYDIPPHSCRSGIPVALRASTPDGPRLRHFRLRMKRRDDLGPDTHHVVALEPVSEEQALSSRRLVLRVDGGTGIVTSVVSGGTPAALFGFAPQDLVGRSVAAFVDALRVQPNNNAAGGGKGTSGGNADAVRALLELTRRSFEAEGPVSVRVGVTPPLEEAANFAPGSMAHSVLMKKTRPAVMAVQLVVASKKQRAGGDGSDRDYALAMSARGSNGSASAGVLKSALSRGCDSRAVVFGADQGQGQGTAPRHLNYHTSFHAQPSVATIPEDDSSLHYNSQQYNHLQLPTAGARGRRNPSQESATVPLPTQGMHKSPSQSSISELQQLLADGTLLQRPSVDLPPVIGAVPPGHGGHVPPSPLRKPAIRGTGSSAAGAAGGGGDSWASGGDEDDVMPLTQQAALVDKALQRLQATGEAMAPGEGPVLEITLWRSDLLVGVLELDAEGKVVAPPPPEVNPLTSAAMLLGLPDKMLEGVSVRALLPLGTRALADLYEPNLGQGGGWMKAKRGLLKSANRKAQSKPGAINTMTTMHFGDGQELTLTVQAVPKTGSASRMHLLLHPKLPAASGRPDLLQHLLTAPSAAAALAAAKAAPPRALAAAAAGAHAEGEGSSLIRTPRGAPGEGINSIHSIAKGGAAAAAKRPGDGGQLLQQALLSSAGGSKAAAATLPAMLPVPLSMPPATVSNRQSRSNSGLPQTGSGLLRSSSGVVPHSGSGTPEGVRWSEQGGVAAAASGMHPSSLSLNRLEEEVASTQQEQAVDDGAPSPHITPSGSEAEGEDHDHHEQDEDQSEEEQEEEVEEEQPEESEDEPLVVATGGGAASVGGASASDIDEAAPASSFTGDYRRGKRFRKLAKMMSNSQVSRTVAAFKWHYLGTLALLLAADMATYIVLMVLVKAERERVVDLFNVGLLCKRLFEVILDVKTIEIELLQGDVYPLFPSADVPGMQDDLDSMLSDFRELHRGVYLGFGQQRTLPASFGLKGIWDDPTLNVTLYYDTLPNITANATQTGLWDAGNTYLKSALHAQQNFIEWANSTSGNAIEAADLSTIYNNGPFSIWHAYLNTVDGYGQLTIQASEEVNNVQLALLIAEGCVVCLLSVLYIWIMSQRVAGQRYSLYAVFMAIPQGLTRTLANMSVALDDDEEEEELLQAGDGNDAGAGGGAAGGAGGEEVGVGAAGPTKKFSISGWDPGAAAGSKNRASAPGTSGSGGPGANPGVWGVVKQLMGGGSITRVAPSGKRQLRGSHLSQIALVWPLVAWSAAVLIANAVGMLQLRETAGPIATLNVVNTVAARFHRTLYFTLQLCNSDSPEAKSFYREHLREEFALWTKEYTAMVFGGKAVNDTDPHFALASHGVIDTGGRALDLLYYTNECLSVEPEGCLETRSPYYKIASNGLDVLLKAYMASVDTILQSDDAAATLDNTEFQMVWSLGQTYVEGGLWMMSVEYLSYVDRVYNSCLTVHVVVFALAWICAAAAAMFILRPFVSRATAESKRIAELLSQLPAELDVESLLSRAILSAPAPQKGADAQGPKQPGALTSEALSGGSVHGRGKFLEPEGAKIGNGSMYGRGRSGELEGAKIGNGSMYGRGKSGELEGARAMGSMRERAKLMDGELSRTASRKMMTL